MCKVLARTEFNSWVELEFLVKMSISRCLHTEDFLPPSVTTTLPTPSSSVTMDSSNGKTMVETTN